METGLTQKPRSRDLTEEELVHIPGLASRWVRLANGEKAHYVTSGDTGPAVILLHGGIHGSSGTAGWRFTAPFLGANGFRIYCPDMPGFGLADTNPEYHSRAGTLSHVDFIHRFADALCLDQFHISGNSLGATNSAYYVVNHPDRILSVLFIANPPVLTPQEYVPPKDGKFTPNPNYVGLEWDGTEESMRVLMEGIIYDAKAVWPELITMRNRTGLRQRESRDAWWAGWMPSEGNLVQWYEGLASRLIQLETPMIHLYGMDDVLNPVENGFKIEDKLPTIQAFYPNECGHQGQTDQPDMFNQVFLEFFRDGKVSWPTAQWAGVSRRRPIDSRYVKEPEGGFPPPIPEAYTDPETLRKALVRVGMKLGTDRTTVERKEAQ